MPLIGRVWISLLSQRINRSGEGLKLHPVQDVKSAKWRAVGLIKLKECLPFIARIGRMKTLGEIHLIAITAVQIFLYGEIFRRTARGSYWIASRK